MAPGTPHLLPTAVHPLLMAGLAAVLLGSAAAQHHHDPFAGSNCSCATFCNSTCSINPLPAPVNRTLYRMTPFGVLDLANKNTGDPRGDTSFVLSKKTNAYQCRQDPNQFQCHGLAQFTGDDPNSTDLIAELVVELDGQWGPYLPCNPVNTSNQVKGPWACSTSLAPSGAVPPQCKAAHFNVFGGYCWQGVFPKRVNVDDVGGCCSAASAAGITKWTYNNGVCELYRTAGFPKPCGVNASSGYADDDPVCDCPRVHRTVGRENLTSPSGHRSSYHVVGGEWYSHPEAGECRPGQRVGEGCSWRVVTRRRVINATCMYRRLDANVESYDKGCFAGCAQPHNVTSTCYLKCYSDAVAKMSAAELVEPWGLAFAADGCPEVPI